MRVIIGKAGKSRVLQCQMERIGLDKTLMIDSVGLNVIAHLAKFYTSVNTFFDAISTLEELENDKELLAEIDYVVLSLNALFNDTDVLLKWEQRLGKRFIATIQENQVDPVLMFDLTLPDE